MITRIGFKGTPLRRGAGLVKPLSLVALAMALLAPLDAVAVASPRTPGPAYIALGDSYSSGEGLGPYLVGSEGCDRSPEAFPELVARRLGGVTLHFLACSGATVSQTRGQVASLSAGVLRHSEFTTVTAGGNDLTFSGLIAACIGAVNSTASLTLEYLPGVSSPELCANAISGAASLLGAGVNPVTGDVTVPTAALSLPLSQASTIERRLLSLFSYVLRAEGAVKHREAGPRLLVVQYPTLIGSPGLGACLLSPTPLPVPTTTTAVGSAAPLYPAFANSTSYALGDLNYLLQLETAAVVQSLRSEGYLDVSIAPVDSGMTPLDCATGASPDINGLLLSGSVPSLGAGSFHPTRVGQSVLARAVIRSWRTAELHH